MKQPSLVMIPFADKQQNIQLIKPSRSASFRRTTNGFTELANGQLSVVGVDYPKRKYEGDTVSYKIERDNLNFYKHSSDFTQSLHFKGNSVIESNSSVAPNGKLEADNLVASSETLAVKYTEQVVSTYITSKTTFSIYAKANGGNEINLLQARNSSPYNTWGSASFNLDTGTVINNIAGEANIEYVTNGWYRVSITGTPPNTGSQKYRVTLGDGGSINGYPDLGVLLWGGQVETKVKPLSLIETGSSPTSAGGDDINMYLIGEYISQYDGAYYFDVRFDNLQDSNSKLTFTDGTENNRIQVSSQANGTSIQVLVEKDNDLFTHVETVDAYSKNVKVMVYFKGNQTKISINGETVATDTSSTDNFGEIASFITGNIDFSDNSTKFSGLITDIRAYQMELTDTEANYFTSI